MYQLDPPGGEILKLLDTHAHIHFHQFDKDRKDVIRRIEEKLELVINVGIDVEDSKKALKIAKKSKKILCSVGIHPHNAKDTDRNHLDMLKDLADSEKVVAVGETGLDYYRNFSPKDDQIRIFVEQIKIARELEKPLIIHARDSFEDVYSILSRETLPKRRGVIHAFSGDYTWARKFVDLGFYLGIGGLVTYPKNDVLRDAVRKIGARYLLPETDCPYLPPVPNRGKRNEPIYVEYVILKMSEILLIEPEKLSEILLENTSNLFLEVKE